MHSLHTYFLRSTTRNDVTFARVRSLPNQFDEHSLRIMRLSLPHLWPPTEYQHTKFTLCKLKAFGIILCKYWFQFLSWQVFWKGKVWDSWKSVADKQRQSKCKNAFPCRDLQVRARWSSGHDMMHRSMLSYMINSLSWLWSTNCLHDQYWS